MPNKITTQQLFDQYVAMNEKLDALDQKLNGIIDGSTPANTQLTGSNVVDIVLTDVLSITSGAFQRFRIIFENAEAFTISTRQYNGNNALDYKYMFEWRGYSSPAFVQDVPINNIGSRGFTSEKIDALSGRIEFMVSNNIDIDIDYSIEIRLYGVGDLNATIEQK